MVGAGVGTVVGGGSDSLVGCANAGAVTPADGGCACGAGGRSASHSPRRPTGAASSRLSWKPWHVTQDDATPPRPAWWQSTHDFAAGRPAGFVPMSGSERSAVSVLS